MHDIRTKLVSGAVSLALAYGVLASGTAHAVDRVRWAVPMAFGSNLIALGDTMPWVAQQLEPDVERRHQAAGLRAGQAGPGDRGVRRRSDRQDRSRLLLDGLRESARCRPRRCSAPFRSAWNRRNSSAWMYFGGGDELLQARCSRRTTSIRSTAARSAPKAAGWFRKEINSLDDVKGLKIPRRRLRRQDHEKVGASVTVLPGGELFQALEKGVLDGTEFSLPTVDEQLGFYKVAKYYYLPGWHQPSTNQYLYVNSAAWNKLKPADPGDHRDRLHRRRHHGAREVRGAAGPALAKFEKEGVQVKQVNARAAQGLPDGHQEGHGGEVRRKTRCSRRSMTPARLQEAEPRTGRSSAICRATSSKRHGSA